eukprot:gb/GECG01000014.1/.p1 GENE.gb/GECG01000014.1/~~gb/GECG01000014.1/.p1  ORF type:complete len:342 (+),score=51.44 gb/GECG01000014.1/:1-1026(+)
MPLPSMKVVCKKADKLQKKSNKMYVKIKLADQEIKTSPAKCDDSSAEWNEEMVFERLQYDDVMTISLRNQHALGRSVIGETQIRVDKYYDYKAAEETFEVFSDEEHTRRVGEIQLHIHLLSPEDPAIRAAKLAEEARTHSQGASGGGGSASATASTNQPEADKGEESVSAKKKGQISTEQLDELDFDGAWKLAVQFDYCDFGREAGDDEPRSVSSREDVKSVREISEGLSLVADVSLEQKSGNHLRGTCSKFAPFNEDGSITGSVQRALNNVTFQLQTIDGRDVKSAFTFTFLKVEEGGALLGVFYAHELSDTAGTARGRVRMKTSGQWSAEDESKEIVVN